MLKSFGWSMAAQRWNLSSLSFLLLAALSLVPQLNGQSLGQKTPPSKAGTLKESSPDASAHRVLRARLMDVTSRKPGSPCPVQENFTGDISTNGPAEVKYTWVSFDGGTWPQSTLHFTGPGTQRVSEHTTQGAAGKVVHGWMRLKVLSPNAVLSNQVPYTIICPGGSTGRVTGAVLSTNPVPEPASCPVQVNIHGGITTNGAGDVAYTWTSSDNSTWPSSTLHFARAGTQPVKESWTLGASGQAVNGWVRLKVLSPNTFTSNPAVFRFRCAALSGSN